MFGSRLQDQTFVTGQLTVQHLLHSPFTCWNIIIIIIRTLTRRAPAGGGAKPRTEAAADLPSYFAISSSASSFLAFDTTHLKPTQTGQSCFLFHPDPPSTPPEDGVRVFESRVLTRPASPDQMTRQRNVPPSAPEPCRSPEHNV